MASPAHPSDLVDMYTHRRYTGSVRDLSGRYGAGLIPSEAFPGAGVLRDLSDAPDSQIPLILARYAALRAWVLGSRREGGAVTVHALSAAREHLAATDASWPERDLLTGALRGGPGASALGLLDAAAHAAESLGHHHGARALREAVHRARCNGRFPPPSPS